MTILVTGCTGFVGSVLCESLGKSGHKILRVTRYPLGSGDVRWDPKAGEIDLPDTSQIDGVVHLAGENIAGGRWTARRKREILDSRQRGTRLLCRAISNLGHRPSVMVSASGINYYGTGHSDGSDESAPRGQGFLSDVCEVWEEEARPVEQAGIRLVRLRLGVVLGAGGGMLKKVVPIFRLGLGGRIGSGRQRMSWVALDDVVEIIGQALTDRRFRGAINAVAPEPTTNRNFTEILAAILRRPALFPVPAFAVRAAFGQMADETLLADVTAVPARLRELGYSFQRPELESTLRHELGRT